MGDIASQYGKFACRLAAAAMIQYLIEEGQEYEFISITYKTGWGYVYCISKDEEIISENGFHCGILYKGSVHCNVHPYGVPLSFWLNDFIGGGEGIVAPKKYQDLKWRHND